MMAAIEKRYGPYRWGRYDLLVLTPSFPFGGMENPKLTFATPTILAGDRSLVSLVAHELAALLVGEPRDKCHLARLLAQRGLHDLYRAPGHRRPLRSRARAAMEVVLRLQELRRKLLKELRQRPTRFCTSTERRAIRMTAMTRVAYEKGSALPNHVGARLRP